jgi:hypothetical protein
MYQSSVLHQFCVSPFEKVYLVDVKEIANEEVEKSDGYGLEV